MAARGHEAVVARLLALVADVGKEDYGGGLTAVHKAAQYGHAGVLAKLLEAGADFNARARGIQSTPLMLAVNFEREACVKLLLARGGRALN